MASSDRPEVFLLNISYRDFLEDLHQPFYDQLLQSAQLKRAKSVSGAIRYLESNTPKAILAADEGLSNPENIDVLKKVESYVRNGGLLILGIQFSNFIRLDKFDEFFKNWGLSWTRGDYHRSTFQYNSFFNLPEIATPASIPGPFSMKVNHISGAKANQKMFVPVVGATTESHVFPRDYVDNTQAAIVGAKVGEGHLVYIGDVNNEAGTHQIILALCGL